MSLTSLNEAIQRARAAAMSVDDFKGETYTAVLIAGLLGPFYSAAVPRSPSHSSDSAISPFPAKALSAAEFLKGMTRGSEMEKVLATGRFLEVHERRQHYTASDLRACLSKAKLAPPRNVNLAIYRAVKEGFMMEIPDADGRKKAWCLTQSGEKRADELSAPVVAVTS